ncbi:SDR family oxidoreductase [Marinivivus vitaminiproducens]|uniref:SDR family oxidoreductase n=1 Tax=Marinivivus vitaminiproducens TaxID=3035935 RepID=UPI00279A5DCB|nr:SDR family NAD(P)-dependent oxidoreductase [Geminicoccaceae bacterium SCSIO 64248]
MTDKKIAMVTGAGTGVGKAVSKELLAAGFTVVMVGRRFNVLEEAAEEIAPGGSQVLLVSADVGDPGSVKAAFETVEQTFGRLDLLVNNAGTGAPAIPIEELSFQQWSDVVAANLTGAFLCTQHAFRIMKAQTPRGGRIVNNGSVSATTPRPNSAPYTATKHAITGLTKAANLDGRAFDIAVGQIDIGNATTPMTARMATGVLQADGSTAVEPTIDPVHIGKAVAYMASLPLDANVLTMTVMANKMPMVGRG